MLTLFLWRRLSGDTEVFDGICQHDIKLILTVIPEVHMKRLSCPYTPTVI